jgi:hypothetical protein
MKNVIRLATIGLMALAIAGTGMDALAEGGTSSPVSQEAAKGRGKTVPFHGTLKAVDREANTITVGNRTFKLSPETKYLQGGMETAKIGEKVGGSYWKEADGTLMVNSVRFGPKSTQPKQEKGSEE